MTVDPSHLPIVWHGRVHRGKQQGRTLGFPTLNIHPHDTGSASHHHLATLPDGTYSVNVVISTETNNNKTTAVYAGCGPWFGFADRQLCEVHLIDIARHHDHDKDLYGVDVSVIMLNRLRPNRRFDTPDELRTQISADVETRRHQIREHTHTVLTFGTFDGLHPGHQAYFDHARWYGDRIVTIVGRDETVARLKGRAPRHSLKHRIDTLRQTGWTDHVVPGHTGETGDQTAHYQCIDDHCPCVIALGYDQHSFDRGLRQWLDANGHASTAIVRLPSHHPDRYKSSLIYDHPHT